MGVATLTRGKALTTAECRRLHDEGKLRTDGRDRVPLNLLWFRTEHVVAYAQRQLGADLDRSLIAAGLRPKRHANGAWDAMARREWVRFDTADRMMCALGLTTFFLDEPMFSPGPPNNPQLVAAIARRAS